LSFDDAEINRQYLQLLSDMAGAGDCESVDTPVEISPITEIEQDALAIA